MSSLKCALYIAHQWLLVAGFQCMPHRAFDNNNCIWLMCPMHSIIRLNVIVCCRSRYNRDNVENEKIKYKISKQKFPLVLCSVSYVIKSVYHHYSSSL